MIWITMYHMRRRDKEVADPGELRRVLLKAKYVTLALCVENEPHIATLNHGYDVERNVIYFHCAGSGKKLDFLRRNPAVWGQALLDMGSAGLVRPPVPDDPVQGSRRFRDGRL